MEDDTGCNDDNDEGVECNKYYDDIFNSTEIDDDGFEEYVQTTTDPGPSLFIFTLSICIASYAALPFLVALGERRARLRRTLKLKQQTNDVRVEKEVDISILTEDSFRVGRKKQGSTGADPDEDDQSQVSIFGCLEFTSEHTCQGVADGDFDGQDDSEIQTSFFCMEMELVNEVLPKNELACDGSGFDHSMSSFVPFQEHEKDERHHKKRKYSENELVSTSCINPRTKSDKKFRKKDSFSERSKSKKKRYKTIIRPRSCYSSGNALKTTPLDGGFFGQRKNRRHHIFSESQMLREEKKDLENAAKKRQKMEVEIDNTSHLGSPAVESILTNADEEKQIIWGENKGDPRFCGSNDAEPKLDACCNQLHSDNLSIECDKNPTTSREPSYTGKCCDHSFQSPSRISAPCFKIITVIRLDDESKRILSLMTPLTITAIVGKLFEAIDIYLISWGLGTDALAGYVVAGYLISFTNETLKGFTDAQSTLCAHAIGAGNYHLAGQLIQLSQILFFLVGAPFIAIWGLFTYDFLIWLDLGRHIAKMGQEWASVAMLGCVVNGINESLFRFLTVIDTDIYSNIAVVMMNAVQTLSIAIALYNNEHTTLVDVALIKSEVAVLFIALNLIFLFWRGWLDLYWDGMVKSNSLRNRVAVKQVLQTGIPLAVGAIARESEWVVLFLLASGMGPAELATWALLRTFWDIFAASMEGICCAAEIRSAYHIGKGNHEMAKLCSLKSLLIGTVFGVLWTFVALIVFEEHVPKWFTHDDTLQNMMLDLVPLLCICNINMSIGMLCWSLVGAQGRYRLATLIIFLSGWFVKVPLASFVVYKMNTDLQGLVASVSIGYSSLATVLLYLFIRSNWRKRIIEVQKSMEVVDDTQTACMETRSQISEGFSSVFHLNENERPASITK